MDVFPSPLEVTTDKYLYEVGEIVNITLTNIGLGVIEFMHYPWDQIIVDSDGNVVVDSRMCWVRLMYITPILPGANESDAWGQNYLICDDFDIIPPSWEQVPMGKYEISVGLDYATYGGVYGPVWGSTWIEIGPAEDSPVADAGPDQTVNVGDLVQFVGTESYDPQGDFIFEPSQIVNDVNMNGQGAPEIAVDSEGNIHIVWADNRERDSLSVDVYYSRSIDDGNSFEANIRVNHDQERKPQTIPVVAVNEDLEVFVAWSDGRDYVDPSHPRGLYLAKSEDNGQSFGSSVKVNDVPGAHGTVHRGIAIDTYGKDDVYLAWEDRRNMDVPAFIDIYFAKSSDGGESFGPNKRVTDDEGFSQWVVSMDADGNGTIYITWVDCRDWYSTYYEIYFSKSIDGGDSFSPNLKITRDDAYVNSGYPSVVADSFGNVYVVWRDDRNPETAPDIYMSKSADGGDSFGENTVVTDDANSTGHIYPDVALNTQGDIYVVWEGHSLDDHDSDIYLSFSTNGGETFGRGVKVNDYDDGIQTRPKIAVDGQGRAHVVWQDQRADFGDIYYALGTPTLAYEWDFGDGSPHGNGSRQTHVYDTPGVYEVTLLVENDQGVTDIDTCTVTVVSNDQDPVADAGGPYFASEGESILFDASGSFGQFGTPLEYRWDFENDSIWDTSWSSSPFVNYTYPDDFDGNAALELRNLGAEVKEDVNVTGELKAFSFVSSETSVAQSFRPFESTLAKILVDCSVNNPNIVPDDDLHLSIREDLNGSDLAVASVSESILPRGPGGPEFWAEFDIPDIDLVVGKTYYIVVTSSTLKGPYEVHHATNIYQDGASFSWSEASGWKSLESYYDMRFRTYSGSESFQEKAFAPVSIANLPPIAELSGRIPETEVSLRIAGEKWHDVSVELFEDGKLIAGDTIVRDTGSPDDQMLTLVHLEGDVTKKYSATILYTPDDDPINGQSNGANPCWIILRFSDGEELWLEHTFNVQHPESYIWEVDLTASILMHGLTFEATAFDPGSDDLTFYWDFGDGTSATSFYPNVNGTYPVQITGIITHIFQVAGTHNITLTVEDDDGGVVAVQIVIMI
jgi:PKD repeat protein